MADPAHCLLNGGLLFAQQVNRFDAMGSEFRGEAAKVKPHEILTGIAVVLAFCLLMWGLSKYVMTRDRFYRFNNPWSLFRALCRQHELNRGDVQLLRRLARQQNLEQPAALFVEASRLVLPESWSDRAHLKERLESLRERLFVAVTRDATTKCS